MAPKKRRSRRQDKRVRELMLIRGPGVGVFTYNGPIETPSEMKDRDTWTTTVTNYTTLASTVGGVIANVFTADPSLSTDFADLALIDTRYRVLGFEIIARPINRYSKVTTTCVPGVGVLDRNNATALASLNAAEGYSSQKELSLEDPWRMVIKDNDLDEGSYIQLGGPTAFMWIKLYFTGLTASTDYMQVLQRWRLQIRDRR